MSTRRILFFTGGTALRELSRELAKINPDTVHLVTTFDSGGSTAILRKVFAIPAVGDIRNRLLALADRDKVSEEIIALCNERIAKDISEDHARLKLLAYADANNPLWEHIPHGDREIIQESLLYFFKRMPPNFDARGASLGNIMLAGTYLEHNRDFNPVLCRFNNLLSTRGIVLPIVNASLNLCAKLKNGEIIVGQHRFDLLPSPIARIFLTVHEAGATFPPGARLIECFPTILPEAAAYLATANAICYPMGSFYSSVLANLVPRGVGRAVAASQAIKIFIPNSGEDHESQYVTVPEQARILLRRLHEDAPYARNEELMQFILIDKLNGRYPGGWTAETERELHHLGLQIVDRNIVKVDNPRQHIPIAVANAIHELLN